MSDASAENGHVHRERRALAILGELLDLTSEERTRQLDALRASDENLFRMVRRLLEAHDAPDDPSGIFRAPASVFAEPLIRSVDNTSNELPSPLKAVAAATEGRFALKEELGRGGHAVVVRARDTVHNRDVAIKAMLAHVETDTGIRRFAREIGIVARLQHPYIVPLLDSGNVNGTLYYVMPFLDGETLRQRLDRTGPLSVPSTLAILNDLAEALDYAHSQGVVHRDIKPQNVMLCEGHALLMDFGIALTAVRDVSRETAAGVAVGTPYYMSPEQIVGNTNVDKRSDVYALACLAFELLTGEVPYGGSSIGVVQARVLNAPIPDPRVLRPTLAPGVSQVFVRGLAKIAADRTESAGAFVKDLHAAVDGSAAPHSRRAFSRAARIVVGVAAAVAIVGWGVRTKIMDGARNSLSAAPNDSIALIPFEHVNGAAVDAFENRRLRDAFRRWSDLPLVDSRRIDEALLARNGQALRLATAAKTALEAGAGRYVWGSIVKSGDRTTINASLYDARHNGVIAEFSAALPADERGVDSVYKVLADALLFGDLRTPELRVDPVVGSDYTARREFFLAQNAIANWNLAEAEARLAKATDRDRTFTTGWLWLALVRRWSGQEPPRWAAAATQALAGSASLSHRDSSLAAAMSAIARDSTDAACQLLEQLSRRYPSDFASLFAQADCESRDNVVIRDARSPSRWRFRRSPYHAMTVYLRAFQLLPSAPTGLRPNGFDEAQRLLQGSANILLRGRALRPDTGRFYAYPSLDGDSVLYVPFHASALSADSDLPSRFAPHMVEALRKQRESFRDLAIAWLARYPRSSTAYEALGLALQRLGDPAARDTVRQARRFATTPEDHLRAYITSAIVELHAAMPNALPDLAQARTLAESALTVGGNGDVEVASLASLAAFTGRLEMAARLAQRAPKSFSDLSPAVSQLNQELLTFAAMGIDTTRTLRLAHRVDSLIAEAPVERRDGWRAQTVDFAAVMMLPSIGLSLATRLPSNQDPLFVSARLLLRGDTAATLTALRQMETGRRFVPPSDWTFDVLVPEAWLRVQAGDAQGGARVLDLALAAQNISSSGMANQIHAASLVRAMSLRAVIANQLGDRATAVRWATAVLTLFAGADDALQPLLTEMRRLMS